MCSTYAPQSPTNSTLARCFDIFPVECTLDSAASACREVAHSVSKGESETVVAVGLADGTALMVGAGVLPATTGVNVAAIWLIWSFWTRLFPVSATYKLPAASRPIPVGPKNCPG